MKRLLLAAAIVLSVNVYTQAQTLEDYTGLTAAQLSAMQDRVTVPNTAYWNTHAYLQLQLLIARVLTLSDSTGVFTPADSSISWAKLMTAVQDSIQKTNRIGTNGVLWAMLAAAVRDSVQLKDRLSAGGVTWAKLAAAVQDSISKWTRGANTNTIKPRFGRSVQADTFLTPNFYFPSADGAPGQVVTTDGGGTWSYATKDSTFLLNSSVGSDNIINSQVQWVDLDTAATGWYDVRKFGAVGDSTTDNAAAIRAALKYVHNAGGGVLMFPGGPETIYGIKDTLHIYSNTTLTSDGAWVKRLSSSTHIQMFQMSDADNITFDHFNIDGNELQENVIIGGCDNLTITNCNIKNAGVWSIRSISDTNVVIANNHFWNCQTPIGIWSSYKARIENNIVDNRLFDGVAFGGIEAGITIVTAVDMRVIGNTWYRAVDSVAATPCETIYINNASGTCSDITVSDNKIYIYTAGQFGISLSATAHGITDVVISGNYINGNRTIGAIELGGTDRCSVDNNIIVNTFGGSPDIAINGGCEDLSITNNKIYDSPYSGLWGTGGVKNLVVSGNIFNGSVASYAISLSYIYNGVFTGNAFDSTFTGIGVEGSDGVTISNNQFNAVTGGNTVIGLNNSKRINLSNNTFNYCGGYAPIFTAGVYDVNIVGNKLFKSNRFVFDGGYGIDRATISENVIMYSTSEGNSAIALTGSQRTVITNNKLIGGDVSFVSLASASGDTVYNPVISGNVIIADSTVAERGHNAISLTAIKRAEISNNSIYIKRGYDAWSWVPLVSLTGNSDSCVVKNNTITGDSTNVWDTTAIYLADSTADHNIISGNIIRGFAKGIHNNSNRSGNIVTDNEVTNCTTAYEQAGGAVGTRSRYYNAADSSLAFIIWNPTLARADTVFAKQP